MIDAPPKLITGPEPTMAAAAAAFLHSFERSTLPLFRALVAECCRAPRVDQRLATILEDIGQEFIGLSYPINAAAYAQQEARRNARKRASTDGSERPVEVEHRSAAG